VVSLVQLTIGTRPEEGKAYTYAQFLQNSPDKLNH
jgi:hypothetical protein